MVEDGFQCDLHGERNLDRRQDHLYDEESIVEDHGLPAITPATLPRRGRRGGVAKF